MNGMRTGSQYLASLRDGRRVTIDGQVVKDVTVHPAFAGISAGRLQAYLTRSGPTKRK